MKATKTTFRNWTEGHLASALMTASEMGDNSLQKCIDRLMNYGADILMITNDYAPLSFVFGVYKRSEEGAMVIDGERCQMLMNGGIIFHGQHDNGGDGSAPTFAVSLTPTNGWAIHT